MRNSNVIRGLIATLCAALLASSAFADIKSFNAAVKAGDYKTASAEAEQIWKSWDRSKEDTALVAREFGFASLIAGRNELALQFGKFLVENGAGLAVPDKEPLASAVLYRTADYKVGKSKAQLEALRAALNARSSSGGFDMTSVVAWELLYTSDWSTGDWASATTDALAAAQFLSRQPPFLSRQRSAEVHAAAAQFIQGKDRVSSGKNNYYDAMADVHDRIVADLNTSNNQSDRASLWPLKWRAEAWALAIESYLISTYEQVGSNISTKMQPRALARPLFGEIAEDPALAQTPLCDGQFEGKRMQYPANKEYSGLVGSVIARVETAANGKVAGVAIVAAVPGDGFGEAVAKTLSTWTFKTAKGVDPRSCRTESRNRYYKVLFRIG